MSSVENECYFFYKYFSNSINLRMSKNEYHMSLSKFGASHYENTSTGCGDCASIDGLASEWAGLARVDGLPIG